MDFCDKTESELFPILFIEIIWRQYLTALYSKLILHV